MSLYISVNTPSAEFAKSPIDEAITYYAASIAMEKRIGTFPQGPKLDITFSLSSYQEAPPFNGMRMGPYDDQNQTLYFETAIPPQMTQSEVAPRYVEAILQDVINNAHDYFSELGVSFDIYQWQEAIGRISQPDSMQTTH